MLQSLLNGTLLSLSLELFIEASFARGISSSSELLLPTSCKIKSSLVSESLLGAELVTLDLGPLVSLIVDAVAKAADNWMSADTKSSLLFFVNFFSETKERFLFL